MKERVIAERERRALSVREAAVIGGVSNTAWSRYEDTGRLTPKMQRAIAQAFDWDIGWPAEAAGVIPPDEAAALREQVADLARQLQELGATVEQLGVEVKRLRDRPAQPARGSV